LRACLAEHHDTVAGEVEVRNVQPDRFAAAEPKVTEKAKEGNVPETFRTRLRLCDGADRLVGLETRSARVAVGLRLHVLHRQCPGHEAERIGELHEAPKSGEAAIPRISDQEANRERLQGTCCTSRAADYGIRIEGSINVDMKVVKARTDTVVAVFRNGLERWLKTYPSGRFDVHRDRVSLFIHADDLAFDAHVVALFLEETGNSL
jgi:hypothetical protein